MSHILQLLPGLLPGHCYTRVVRIYFPYLMTSLSIEMSPNPQP